MDVATFRPDVLARFWAKVNKTDTCWLWTAALNTQGYGRVRIDKVLYQAHRVSFVLAGGVIPEGLHIDHLCRVRACVNPAHMEPVTCRENILRGVGVSATNAVKTHCPNGHPYSGENLYVYRGRGRQCRECLCARARAKYHADRALQVGQQRD